MLCGRVLMMMTWSWILSPQCPHIQADDGSRGDTRPLSPRHPNIFLDLEIFLAESEPRLLCCPQSTLQLQVSVCRSVKERSLLSAACSRRVGACSFFCTVSCEHFMLLSPGTGKPRPLGRAGGHSVKSCIFTSFLIPACMQ